jgi:serine acetyltransferase
VINNIDICKNCIVGAGAVVVNNITETGTYVSIPVRKIK